MRDDELPEYLLMHDCCRRIYADNLPGGRLVAGLVFAGPPEFAHWWIIIEANRECELCVRQRRR